MFALHESMFPTSLRVVYAQRRQMCEIQQKNLCEKGVILVEYTVTGM